MTKAEKVVIKVCCTEPTAPFIYWIRVAVTLINVNTYRSDFLNGEQIYQQLKETYRAYWFISNVIESHKQTDGIENFSDIKTLRRVRRIMQRVFNNLPPSKKMKLDVDSFLTLWESLLPINNT